MLNEIREAVEHLKFRLNFSDMSETPLDKRNDDVDRILLDLAERVLNGEYVKRPSVEEIEKAIIDRLEAAGSIGTKFFEGKQDVKIQIRDIKIFALAIVRELEKGE